MTCPAVVIFPKIRSSWRTFGVLNTSAVNGREGSATTSECITMQNDEGVNVDLYIPRKCSATHRLITAKDHASVQISVGKVDQDGKLTGEVETFALCGYIRAMGEADSAMNRLARANGYLSRVE